MIASLSPRDRRTLLVGAAIIATLVAASQGLPRYRAWRGAALAAAERETTELARTEASIAGYAGTVAALDRARHGRAAVDSLLLAGATASDAGTALAAAISEAAEGAEAKLGSIQVHPDSSGRTRLARVSARASVTGDVESLALFLESLEAGPPLLAVREWSISGGAEGIAPNQPALLRMDVVVEGLAQPERRRPAR